MKSNKSGYILILTLMIISILVIIVTSMFYKETSHSALSKTIIDREKAKMLALAGVQLAVSQLSIVPEKKTDEQKKEKEQSEAKEKGAQEAPQANKYEIKFLKKILPALNSWQTVNLKEDIDGINGQIKIYISSENGKININNLYDFAKHKFLGEGQALSLNAPQTQNKEQSAQKQQAQPQAPAQPQSPQAPQQSQQFDAKKLIQDLSAKIREYTQKDIIKGLQEFLSKRKFPLNDVTELLEIPEFAYFRDHVFYEQTTEKKKPIFLTDIFTTWTTNYKMQPLVFSDSIREILGLKRPEETDLQTRKKLVDSLIKNFKPNIQWRIDWDKILKPIYGKDFNMLNKQIEHLLDTQFGPKSFSVVSYGKVGDVIQRIFAIVEIETSGNNEMSIAKIKKIYWT